VIRNDDMIKLGAQKTFNDTDEIIEWVSRMVRHGQNWEYSMERLPEFHEYVQKYLTPDAYGKNVLNCVLDDAIRLRARCKDLEQRDDLR